MEQEKMKRTITIMAAVLGLALIGTACSSKPTGFHNPQVLAKDIAVQITMENHSSDSYTDQLALAQAIDSGATPTDVSVTCSKMDDGTYTCNYGNGPIHVKVSADGQSYEITP
jgi:hypothetical protein